MFTNHCHINCAIQRNLLILYKRNCLKRIHKTIVDVDQRLVVTNTGAVFWY